MTYRQPQPQNETQRFDQFVLDETRKLHTQQRNTELLGATASAIGGVVNAAGRVLGDPAGSAMKTGMVLSAASLVFPPAAALGVPLMMMGAVGKAGENMVEHALE